MSSQKYTFIMFQFLYLVLFLSLCNVNATVRHRGCSQNNINIYNFISPDETCAEITCSYGVSVRKCKMPTLRPGCFVGSTKQERQQKNFPECCPVVFCGGVIFPNQFVTTKF
uniref:Uncharacterized protein LOC114340324 n=1 Tax=Diabrotica virgifera virgifera TaxID=50390 RepID=A0A6P7GBX6_DIAVI